MDDHNAKQRHAPIWLEHVWATKYWPHMPFAFLLSVTEVNVILSEAYFVHHNTHRPQLESRKLIAKDLIDNEYLKKEISSQEIYKSKNSESANNDTHKRTLFTDLPKIDSGTIEARYRYVHIKCNAYLESSHEELSIHLLCVFLL